MTLSIKGGVGIINEVPKVSDLKVTAFETETIDIEYKVEDVELTICRHYLYVNGSKKEITKEVGYESDTNIFKYQITRLKMNTPYTIQIGASDGLDEGLSKAIQQTTKNYQIFGVKVMENNSNPSTCCTYIEEAIGITPANSTSLGDWADKFPFNKIRIVGFKGGKVTKEIKKEDKTQYIDGTTVPTDVDVMVEIPKVYWKFTNIENGYELRISGAKIAESDCYAHKVGGAEKDFIYVGAYLGCTQSEKLRSISGVAPTTDATLTSFRNCAHNVGNGYQQFNWFTLILLQILYLIAYKNLNSQQALGMGVCNTSNKVNTGGTNKKGWIYGSSNKAEQVSFLGIEDLWGNIYQWIDGIFRNPSNQLLVTPDNKVFNDNGSGFKNTGQFPNKSMYGTISKVAHSNENGFYPKECNGSDTTYYSDYAYYQVNNLHAVWFGGCWSYKLYVGIFSFRLDNVYNYTNVNIGGRLCYLG